MARLMANHPDRIGDSLRFCLIARIECPAGSLDESQLSRKVLFESIHFGTFLFWQRRTPPLQYSAITPDHRLCFPALL
jgi:hypothetical protein